MSNEVNSMTSYMICTIKANKDSKLNTSLVCKLACGMFILAFLVPQGVGYRFEIAQLDLQRALLLMIVGLGMIITIQSYSMDKVLIVPRGGFLVVLMAVFYVISALTSSNPTSGIIFASQMILVLLAAPFFLAILVCECSPKMVVRSLTLLLAGLLIYALVEILIGTQLIRPWMRTSFWGIEGYNWSENIVYDYTRGGLALVQGPFFKNHGMAAVLCALAGIAFYYIDRNRLIGFFVVGLFFIAISATGVRAAVVAVSVAVLVHAIFTRKISVIIIAMISISAYSLFLHLDRNIGDDKLPFVVTSDLNESSVRFFQKKENITILEQNPMTSYEPFARFLSRTGTIGERVAGLILNISNWREWIVTGYGFGSFQRPDQYASSAIQYNDPGLWFLILFESGVVAAGLLAWLCGSAFFLGLRKLETLPYSIGILTAFVFGLSSWEIWVLPFVVFQALMILRLTGEKRSAGNYRLFNRGSLGM